MQKQQYQQKKKLIFGDGQRIGPEDDRFSLDKMKLDGDDKGGAANMFDPFAKKDVSIGCSIDNFNFYYEICLIIYS